MIDSKISIRSSLRHQLIESFHDDTILDRNSVLIPKFKLVWEDITYRIKYDKKDLKKLGLPDHVKEKTLLDGVSGHAKSGETTFIMGSSGAGKTTLLNSLCDRITKNKKNIFSGSVTINDSIEVEQKTFGNYGSYVMQDDVLFETFTCYECLFFAAKLRLNRTMDIILERIEEVIAQLGLEKCRNTLVGNVMLKGLSGGEKKRTAIAVELITNPKVIFLDEPTSGLDSFTTLKLVKLMKEQAFKGKMVISTIHQPSSQAFGLFDKLILMSEGRIIYQGRANEATNYFARVGFQCPKYCNPADFFLKEFYIPHQKTEDDIQKIGKLNSSYESIILPKIEKENKVSFHVDLDGFDFEKLGFF